MPKKPLIDYTSADFESIKEDLVEHAKRYYPQRYNDFNESSFGAMMFDSVAYVGDMLSYYLDFQVNESYMDTAIQWKNVRKIASQMGYNFYGKSATFGLVDIYILVPALENDLGPIEEILPIVKRGTKFRNSSGAIFTLVDDVDFDHPNIPVVASKFDNNTGKATEFALRATGKVKSGQEFYTEVDVGDYLKFRRVKVGANGINDIISVHDTQGNEYYQVQNLSQEVIYIDTTNPNVKSDGVRSIMKPHVASRRFVVEQDAGGTFLQFGYGSDNEFDKYGLIDPSNVMLNMHGKGYVSDNAFDPNKLISTDKFGVVPVNTTLRIKFASNNTLRVNTSRNSLNIVDEVLMDFPRDKYDDYVGERVNVEASLEVANPEPIVYDSTVPTVDEIKYRAHAVYAAQNRIVTKYDYEAYCYQMPPKYGSIKRVSVYNDPSGTNKRLCLYVISSNNSGHLVPVNDTTKINLKTWLNKNKMISDLIDVKDAKVINVGFTYEMTLSSRHDRTETLGRVQARLQEHFSETFYIGEPLYITEIYNLINKTEGVIDALKVYPRVINSAGYSDTFLDIDDLLSSDGTYIKAPANCVLEIKYPSVDIKGVSI